MNNHVVMPNGLTYKPLAYAVLLSLAAVSPAIAQDAQQNTEAGETLVVTASNTAMKIDTPAAETPRSVSEVTLEDLKDRGVRKIDEAMRYSAGIQTGHYGADNRTDWLIIRGFEWSPYQNGLQTITNEAGFYYGIRKPTVSNALTPLRAPPPCCTGKILPASTG